MLTIDAPDVAPAPGGLLDVARVIPDTGRVGYEGLQYEDRLHGPALPVPTSGTKTFVRRDVRSGGTPFKVYRGIEHSLLSQSNDLDVLRAAFARGEGFAVERGVQAHMDTLAVDITPTVGTAVNIVPAIALLEQYIGEAVVGPGFLHTNRYGATVMQAANLIEGNLTTALGTKVVAGAGYNADGPEIGAPVLVLGTTNDSGGTFAADDYFWRITAINAMGETDGSNEVTATLILNGSQDLSWAAVPGATGYKVYRGTATGAQDTLVATLGEVTTYVDTGVAGTGGTVPTTDTTARADAGEFWVYVTGQVILYQGPLVEAAGYDLETNGHQILVERVWTPIVDGVVGAILAKV